MGVDRLMRQVAPSAVQMAGVTKFGLRAVVQGLKHVNGQMLRHLHPQRYALVSVAVFTLLGVMLEPVLRGDWTAPILQPLAFLTLVPCLTAVLGDPSTRIPSNLRSMGFRWAGAALVAWVVIWLLLRLFKDPSWIPIGMVIASVVLLGTVIQSPGAGKAHSVGGKRVRGGRGDRVPESTGPSS